VFHREELVHGQKTGHPDNRGEIALSQRVYRTGFVVILALAWQLAVGGMNSTLEAAPKPPAVHLPHGQGQGHLTATQKNVDIQTIDDVVVRRSRMKELFDQNGKVRQPTPEERAAAKGNSNLPGYEADVNELKAGQVLKLTLLKKKETKTNSGTGQKDSDKETKTEWVPAGTITVVLKNYQDSVKTLTFEVDGATLAGNRHTQAYNTDKGKNKKDNKITLDDFRVKRIEITKEPPDDSKTKKKDK
jgi:hypothetical protein